MGNDFFIIFILPLLDQLFLFKKKET